MRAMAAEAEAARNARAKVIAAEGDHKASRALKHAAEVNMKNPAALQVEQDHNKKIPALLLANSEGNLCRKQKHNHLPYSSGYFPQSDDCLT